MSSFPSSGGFTVDHLFRLEQPASRVPLHLLLIHGSEESLGAGQAEAVFVGLRRLGKRVALRIYEGERHSTWTWSEAGFRNLCAHVLAWFDAHLKG